MDGELQTPDLRTMQPAQAGPEPAPPAPDLLDGEMPAPGSLCSLAVQTDPEPAPPAPDLQEGEKQTPEPEPRIAVGLQTDREPVPRAPDLWDAEKQSAEPEPRVLLAVGSTAQAPWEQNMPWLGPRIPLGPDLWDGEKQAAEPEPRFAVAVQTDREPAPQAPDLQDGENLMPELVPGVPLVVQTDLEIAPPVPEMKQTPEPLLSGTVPKVTKPGLLATALYPPDKGTQKPELRTQTMQIDPERAPPALDLQEHEPGRGAPAPSGVAAWWDPPLPASRWVRSDDGLLELEVPAGAASEADVDCIEIRALAAGADTEELADGLAGDACSAVYAVVPHGQRFERPVVLHFRVVGQEACCTADARNAHAQGVAVLKRELLGMAWEFMPSWVEEDGRVAACTQSFCYWVLRCCQPRVSIAERLSGNDLDIWIAIHTGTLGPDDYSKKSSNRYVWTLIDDCQWQHLLKNGTPYHIQVQLGDHLLFDLSMAWKHGGFLQFPVGAELQRLPAGVRELSIKCNSSLQMTFKLDTLRAAPAEAAAIAPQHSPQACHSASGSPQSQGQPSGSSSSGGGAATVDAAAATAGHEVAAPAPDAPNPAPRSGLLAALIVGNNAYERASGRERLSYAARDAERVQGKLAALGCIAERSFFCCETTGKALEAACVLFVEQLRKQVMAQEATMSADRHKVIIFYAGHAYEEAGHFFMCPVDRPGGVSIESWLLGPLNAINSQKTIVFILVFDACRDAGGPAAVAAGSAAAQADAESAADEHPFAPEMLESADRATWRRINKRRGSRHEFLMLWACDPGRQAEERPDIQGGELTTALLRHLGAPGSAVQGAFQTVVGEVRRATNHTQRPWMETNATRDICL